MNSLQWSRRNWLNTVGTAGITAAGSAILLCAAICSTPDEGRWVHPLCQPAPIDRTRPLVTLSDGALMVLNAQGLRTSKDDGKTWSEPRAICPGILPDEPASSYIVQTKSGA